jgi:dTDP-4-amino-4,6-dideoxygalactose transaminase
LGLLLAGVGPGDEVLLPTFTFVATANAVAYLGAEPVLVDSDPASWCMDAGLVADELMERARRGKLPAAVVSVDLYGGCPDYDALGPLCEHHGVPLVEDAAEALGASYRGRPAGSFGLCAAFSFNGNKIITTGGGGMLVSNSAALVEKARKLSSHAREPAVHYEHAELGFNYRLSNLLAAVGRGQLIGLDRRISTRKATHDRYRAAFESVEGIEMMPVGPGVQPNYWLTCVVVDPQRFGASREDLRLTLEEIDVESRPTWKPLHLQPLFKGARKVGGSVSEAISERGLCLPSGSRLSEQDQERIIARILELGR